MWWYTFSVPLVYLHIHHTDRHTHKLEIYFIFYVSVWMHAMVGEGCVCGAQKRAGAPGSCELPDVVAENRTQVL